MLYYLSQYLENQFGTPGMQVLDFTTVRATLAALTALVVSLVIGQKIIAWLKSKQIGESIRSGTSSGVVDHTHKAGTPTMGGLIIVLSIGTSTLFWGAILDTYVWLILLVTFSMAGLGFADDYLKLIRKNKVGLAPRMKVGGQVSIALVVALVLYFHPDFESVRNLTDLPFLYNTQIDYNYPIRLIFGEGASLDRGWIVFIPLVLFVVTATSNAVNLTDGLDGLATGTTGIVSLGLVSFCLISGNAEISEYLGVMFLPETGELIVFTSAMTAACFAFLWYNGFPATVFMGDTGSLALGAAVSVVALMVKKELLLPLLCLIFFVETLSVIIQTTYFRYTRKKTGTGKRVFRMAPLHHHYEALGIHEAKIAVRFWLVTIFMVLVTLLTLRIQ